jgi:hypothetical protein
MPRKESHCRRAIIYTNMKPQAVLPRATVPMTEGHIHNQAMTRFGLIRLMVCVGGREVCVVGSDGLGLLQQRLLALHPGSFQDDDYLLPWCPPAICQLLLQTGIVLRPARVVYQAGLPMRCHENALTYATLHTKARAYFGFGLYDGLWWGHSFCVEAEGGRLWIHRSRHEQHGACAVLRG